MQKNSHSSAPLYTSNSTGSLTLKEWFATYCTTKTGQCTNYMFVAQPRKAIIFVGEILKKLPLFSKDWDNHSHETNVDKSTTHLQVYSRENSCVGENNDNF